MDITSSEHTDKEENDGVSKEFKAGLSVGALLMIAGGIWLFTSGPLSASDPSDRYRTLTQGLCAFRVSRSNLGEFFACRIVLFQFFFLSLAVLSAFHSILLFLCALLNFVHRDHTFLL